MTLLIADDQQSVHTYLSNAIPWKNYGIGSLLHAYDGRECLQYLEKEHLALLILDIKMPYFDGIEILQKMSEQGILPKTILLTAYSDFSYAKKAIDYGVTSYLLKPIQASEMCRTVETVAQKLRSEISGSLRPFLLDSVDAKDQQQLRYVFENHPTAGILIWSADYEALRQTEKELLRAIPSWHMKVSASAILLFPEEKWNWDSLFKVLQEKEFPQRIRIALSGVASGCVLSCLKDILTQCREIMEGFYYAPGSNLLTNVLEFGELPFHVLEEKRKRILSAIMESCSTTAVEQSVEDLFETFRKVHIKPSKLVQCSFSLLTGIASVVKTSSLAAGWVDIDQDLYQCLVECPDIFTLQKMFTDKILSDYFFAKETGDGIPDQENWSENLKEYLRHNMNRQLTLEEISQRFYLNKYDLCRRFKLEAQENIWQYLTRIRMEQAKDFLTRTDMKIYEIAESVGYNSSTYFSNVFKKYSGVSPQQYKEDNQNALFLHPG